MPVTRTGAYTGADMSVDPGRLLAEFRSAFARAAEVVSAAPGRVNLIGEHTDYNAGFVLPVAIDRSVAVAAAGRDDHTVRALSLDYGECDEFELDNIARTADWRAYIRGVAWALREDEHALRGADLVITGDVPRGAGLSSSAAVELAAAGAMSAVASVPLAPRAMALLSQKAENEFAGVPCGIMDQFASALSRAGHALLIDCRSQEVEHIPLTFEDAGVLIVVVDSKAPRQLGQTAYAKRQEECREAARLLGVDALRDADVALLGSHQDETPTHVWRRARHVITENTRVIEAVEALRDGDVGRFGRLMYESHESLRDDFEVSCPELDLLIKQASGTDGVLGARLTGAGFGGCTVNIVREAAIEDFRDRVIREYQNETGLAAEMHVCRAVDGLVVTNV